jgi:hypothetical protein
MSTFRRPEASSQAVPMSVDLFEDHRAIVALSEELLVLLRRNPRPTVDELTQLRTRVGSRAAQHLRDEDALIIRPLLATGRIDEIPGARDTIVAIRESRAQYSNHVGKWTRGAIHADWDGYVHEMTDMIERLKQILAREERELYRPALQLLGE